MSRYTFKRGTPFWQRMKRTAHGCLEWQGARHQKAGEPDKGGYGEFRENGKLIRAHRRAWELHHGTPIPAGLAVLHACDNPPCCEPAHLYLGTVRDNAHDMVAKGRGANQYGYYGGR
jgi:hypothetical protein